MSQESVDFVGTCVVVNDEMWCWLATSVTFYLPRLFSVNGPRIRGLTVTYLFQNHLIDGYNNTENCKTVESHAIIRKFGMPRVSCIK